MIELAVIVSSLNRAALLKQALSSLREVLPQLHLRCAVIVMDAGSLDDSQEVVRNALRHCSFPVVLLERKGLSFSAGLNEAAEHAIQQFPSLRYLLLFETDNAIESATPLNHALELFAFDPKIGAVGFTVRKHDGSANGFGCGFPTPLSFVLGPQLSALLRLDRPQLNWNAAKNFCWSGCDVVYTSPLLIQRHAWERTNGMDAEAFPFSDCDLDWAWRLRKSGLRQAVIQTSAVVHDNQQQFSSWSASRALHFHRARLRLLESHSTVIKPVITPLLAARHICELAAAAVCFGRGYGLRMRKRAALLARCFNGYA